MTPRRSALHEQLGQQRVTAGGTRSPPGLRTDTVIAWFPLGNAAGFPMHRQGYAPCSLCPTSCIPTTCVRHSRHRVLAGACPGGAGLLLVPQGRSSISPSSWHSSSQHTVPWHRSDSHRGCSRAPSHIPNPISYTPYPAAHILPAASNIPHARSPVPLPASHIQCPVSLYPHTPPPASHSRHPTCSIPPSLSHIP